MGLHALCARSTPIVPLNFYHHPPHIVSTTLTRRGQGFARGIKEWGTGTKIQVKFDDKFQPVKNDGKKLKGQLGLIVRSGHRVPLTYLNWNVMHVDIKENIWHEVKV